MVVLQSSLHCVFFYKKNTQCNGMGFMTSKISMIFLSTEKTQFRILTKSLITKLDWHRIRQWKLNVYFMIFLKKKNPSSIDLVFNFFSVTVRSRQNEIQQTYLWFLLSLLLFQVTLFAVDEFSVVQFNTDNIETFRNLFLVDYTGQRYHELFTKKQIYEHIFFTWQQVG